MLKTDLKGLKDFNEIIKETNLKKLIYLSVFLFIGVLVESFGLGALYPIFNFLLNENSTVFLNVEFNSKSNVILFSLFLIGLIYLIKTLYLTILTVKQNKFVSSITEMISNEIFSGYIYNPYSFHLKNNSSELVKNIQVELSNFTAYLSSVIFVVSDFILLVAILGTLIYINPLGTILLVTYLLIASWIFLFITKKKLDVWGVERLKIDKNLALTLTESLKGIKDVKVSRLETLFIKKYRLDNLKKFDYYWKQLTLGQIPRLYLELICIFGFIFFIISTLSENQSINSILPLASVYLAAFFRTLPSINRILSSYQQMRYYLPSVELIKKEINYNRLGREKQITIDSFNKGISLKNITFKYDKKNIFKNFNLELNKGKIYGIKGESGTGKTTLAAIILGLLKPNNGSIYIDNKKVIGFKWSKILSYVSQNIFLFDGSVIQNICLGIDQSKIKIEKINEVLKKTNLYDFVYSFEDNINHSLGENGVNLSGGQAQRLAIARALYNKPKILILDEVTSALDKENERKVLETIKQLGKEITCIIISHKDDTTKICDEIINLKPNKKLDNYVN
tara:strand:- start:3783 stop:5483 length:1701 start_codon:yes stop_codon:yes gene_type:complete